MTNTSLKINRRGACAWVWMSRPAVHNAFDDTLIAELGAAFESLDADPDVRVIVLAGEGKSFSAGADLNWMKRQGAASVGDNLDDARKLANLFRTVSPYAAGRPLHGSRVPRSAVAWGWLRPATFASRRRKPRSRPRR